MRNDLTAIMVLIDASGSMSSMYDGVIDGFNEFVNAQRKSPGEAVISLVQFDSTGIARTDHESGVCNENGLRYKTIYDFKNLKEVEPLTKKMYVPRGLTPYVESMTKAIDEFGQKLASIPEEYRPGSVVFVCISDGLENNSAKDFTKAALKAKVTTQENEFSWKFLYIGTNQDSFAEGSSYGVSYASTMNYTPTSRGLYEAMGSVSASVGSMRSFTSTGGAPASYNMSISPDKLDPNYKVDLDADVKKEEDDTTSS